MNPFFILCWIAVAGIAICAGVLAVIAANATFKHLQESRERKRADAGKLTCQYVQQDQCQLVATRRTSTGYFCNEHDQSNQARGYGSFSFSSPLEHTLRLKD